MSKYPSNRINRASIAALVLFSCFTAYFVFYPQAVSMAIDFLPEVSPTPTPKGKKTPAQKPKYSEFPHNVQQHKMACNSCHKFPTANWNTVRKKDDAFEDITDYPQHASCINCHKQQFFRGSPPVICSICHTNPSPKDSSRHPFPNPREIFDASPKGKEAVSDFAVFFPHDKHVDIISQNNVGNNKGTSLAHAKKARREGESCAVCHQTYKPQGDSDNEYVTKPPAKLGDAFWLKKGTFKSSPLEHKLCFTCHTQDSGISPAQSDCATCHKLKEPEIKTDFDVKLAQTMNLSDKIMLSAWRKRNSAATFRHEWFSHAELACTTCHNVPTMNTTDTKIKRVKVLSCGGSGEGCHVTPKLDDGGILNAEIDMRKSNPGYQCVKCHLSYGSAPVPESHTNAINSFLKK